MTCKNRVSLGSSQSCTVATFRHILVALQYALSLYWERESVCACVYACVCVCIYVHACVWVCVGVCRYVYVCVSVFMWVCVGGCGWVWVWCVCVQWWHDRGSSWGVNAAQCVWARSATPFQTGRCHVHQYCGQFHTWRRHRCILQRYG